MENQVTQVNYAEKLAEIKDSGSIGWGILGFILPVVGISLWAVWRDYKPKCGKKAGAGALTGLILGTVFYVVVYSLSMLIGG